MDILFITRKASGIGGMQRLHADLVRALCDREDLRVRRVAPFLTPACLDLSFPIRAIVAALRLPKGRGVVLLGDAALSPLGALIRSLTSKPVTAIFCGLDLTYRSRLYQWMIRRSIPSCTRIACISLATATEAERLGASRECITVIPCGIWPEQCEVDSGATRFPYPTIVCGGRLVPRKGIAWFVREVMPILASTRPNLRCSIFGSGRQQGAIKNAISDKELSKNVHMLGAISDEEKTELFSSADIFVMPNIPVPGDMEGFGIVCIEAAARGAAVVASELEGIRDAVIEHETGIFFSPGDARDAARAIGVLLAHPLNRSHVSQATFNHFHWSALAGHYVRKVFLPVLS